MIFEALFPYAKHLEEVREGLIWVNDIGPCFICGRLTHFADLDYQDYFCSDECIDIINREACRE